MFVLQMVELNITTLIAFWGAGISTALAIIKLVEFRRTFTRVEANWVLRGHEEIGHDVLILNNSAQPIFITSFDVVRAKRKWLKRTVTKVEFSLEDQHAAYRIESFGAKELNFSEADYFPATSKRTEKFGPLYLRIWLGSSKRPVWLGLG
jgi:hypothetical protein